MIVSLTVLFSLFVFPTGFLSALHSEPPVAKLGELNAGPDGNREPGMEPQNPDVRGIRLNGVVVFISTIATGRITNEGVTRLLNINDKGNTMDITLINTLTGLYIGYGLQVELLDQSTRLRVSIKPLSEETNRDIRESVLARVVNEKWPDRGNPDPQPLTRYPAPQIINPSDTLTLSLWMNPETGATVSDQIRFELDQPAPARDFTLSDVRLLLSDFSLLINGKVCSGERKFRGVSGSLPWLYVPGKGRFIFSLQPHQGHNFQKVGLIERNKLSFSYDGDTYEWICGAPILGPGTWNLWVLHDGDFQDPTGELIEVNQVSKGNCFLYGVLGSPALLPGADK